MHFYCPSNAPPPMIPLMMRRECPLNASRYGSGLSLLENSIAESEASRRNMNLVVDVAELQEKSTSMLVGGLNDFADDKSDVRHFHNSLIHASQWRASA